MPPTPSSAPADDASPTSSSAAGSGPASRTARHPADRLLDAFDRVDAPVCVGLDPVIERLPAGLDAMSAELGFERFCNGVLRALEGSVACVKLQSACFERHGPATMALVPRLIDRAHELGIEVILDAKRGDIGISAAHYAAAAAGVDADWTTVSPYLGVDGIEPFLRDGRGAFALVRTSNPGGDALQSLRLDDGRTVAEAVADLVVAAGGQVVGDRGYSALGAVVGATKGDDAVRLRARLERTILLVPGFGAQGGGVADVMPLFDERGEGAIVTASRSVIYAGAGADWASAVAREAEALASSIRDGLRAR